MKIFFASTGDVEDYNYRSGTVKCIYKSLVNAGIDITTFKDYDLRNYINFDHRLKRKLHKLLHHRFNYYLEPGINKKYSERIHREFKDSKPDLIFSPIPSIISYLKTNIPIITWTDTPFAGAVDFIPSAKNLSNTQIKNGNRIEQLALDKCSLAIYSNHWAADVAVKGYKVNENKIKVIPFGANINPENEKTEEEVKIIVNNRPKDKIKLLFLSGEWENKRGWMTIEIAKTLNNMGQNVELNIVGHYPNTLTDLPDFIKLHGFIDKSQNDGLYKIMRFYSDSHFLLLPTMADCSPCQYREASAFGLPSLGTNVGGSSTALVDGVNGKLFNVNASPKEYADYIINTFNDYEGYKKLSMSSFHLYKEKLNWKTSISKFIDLANKLRKYDID